MRVNPTWVKTLCFHQTAHIYINLAVKTEQHIYKFAEKVKVEMRNKNKNTN